MLSTRVFAAQPSFSSVQKGPGSSGPWAKRLFENPKKLDDPVLVKGPNKVGFSSNGDLFKRDVNELIHTATSGEYFSRGKNFVARLLNLGNTPQAIPDTTERRKAGLSVLG